MQVGIHHRATHVDCDRELHAAVIQSGGLLCIKTMCRVRNGLQPDIQSCKWPLILRSHLRSQHSQSCVLLNGRQHTFQTRWLKQWQHRQTAVSRFYSTPADPLRGTILVAKRTACSRFASFAMPLPAISAVENIQVDTKRSLL